VEKLIKFQDQIRELKKPVMSENLFYGFEDVSDDYDYGTEVYKDDIYEFHQNMQIPYKERNMLYIPTGIFEENCHDIGGYMKLGKESSTKIKFNIQVIIHDENYQKEILQKNNKITNKNPTKKNDEEINFKPKPTDALTKYPNNFTTDDNESSNNTKGYLGKNNISEKPGQIIILKDEKETEQHVNDLLEKIDVFNSFYVKTLKKVFFKKELKKKENKDSLAFPLQGLKVRIYIFRCLNLTAQENSTSLVDNLAGYSAFCKANSFIEIKIGENSNSGDNKGTKYIHDIGSKK